MKHFELVRKQEKARGVSSPKLYRDCSPWMFIGSGNLDAGVASPEAQNVTVSATRSGHEPIMHVDPMVDATTRRLR